MNKIYPEDSYSFLSRLPSNYAAAVITSPPYTGLPGRDDGYQLLAESLPEIDRVLDPDGSLALVVGSTEENPQFPFDVLGLVSLHYEHVALYVLDRTGTLKRDIGTQTVNHDYLLIASNTSGVHNRATMPQSWGSIIKVESPGFNYGLGVTMPPDLARILVYRMAKRLDIIVDPFAGLGEVGVQAALAGCDFVGSDIDPRYASIGTERIQATLQEISA